MTEKPTVALLGTGIMGEPMGANILDAGLNLRVWNRTAEKAKALADKGATVAGTPAEAATGAQLVLTMLADGPSVRAVMAGPDGALSTMDDAAVWVQSSTVGVQHTEELAALARERGARFVDAPVLGTKQPAEQGKLVVLAAGAAADKTQAQPLFDAVGARTIDVGDEPGAASRLKLVANNWVLALTGATAETFSLAKALNVDPKLFLDAISGGPLDVGYAHAKGDAMIDGEFPPSFPLALAAKDARLVVEAAGGATNLAMARAVLEHLETADAQGHGDKDMAALYYAVTEQG